MGPYSTLPITVSHGNNAVFWNTMPRSGPGPSMGSVSYTHLPASWFFIQDMGGTASSIAHGVDCVRWLRTQLRDTPRVPMRLRDLVIGAECGGSDYTSGLAGNVAVGRFYDFLTAHGGTAIFEEIVEAVGLRGLLARCV